MNLFFLRGDFRFFFPENIKDFITFPKAWDSSLNTGLGQSQLSSLWITSYFNFTALFTKLGLDWNIIQIIFWITPAILLSFFSSFSLFNHLFKEKKYSLISGLVYSLNTYFLMILTGGQLGVSLSYSLVPLVFLSFVKLLEKANLKNSLLAGLVLSLQIIFDPRIVYLTLILVILYFFFNFSKFKSVRNKYYFLIPFIISILLNSYWLLPLILTRNSTLPAGFESTSGFKFFSFADFSHSISLLHPNWPENIFGKIYFLDPKFLILPILAFGSLLFKKNRGIIFFSFLALLGIFLAKGANPPLGGVNELLFAHFPGMSVFRDPTKWYILISLSFSILIPYSLKEISRYFKLAPLLFILYFLFLITPISTQFKTREVPQEYVQLKNFISEQQAFSRTLWIPKWQRYGFFSNNHPAIGREELYKGSAGKQIEKLNENQLRDLSVKYIIVPYDSESEIFLKDRKYNDKEYLDVINRLKNLSWLKEKEGFGKVKVFELSSPRDHFWSQDKFDISYQFLNANEYKVSVKNAKKGDLLVFSEGFDKNWVLEGLGFKVQNSKFEEKLNSFSLPKEGNYDARARYEPQKYVEAGFWISGITLLNSLLFLFSSLERKLRLFGKRLKTW